MHENREISWTSWSKDQDRSAKVINRTADVHVQEKSDCAIVPMNQPNNEDLSSTEVGEGRAWRRQRSRLRSLGDRQAQSRRNQSLRDTCSLLQRLRASGPASTRRQHRRNQ